jgi:hypothetical protein
VATILPNRGVNSRKGFVWMIDFLSQ